MRRIVITSGGTREYIDDVRFISNVSTGALGAKIADVFAQLSWDVTLIHAQDAVLPREESIKRIPIISASDACETLLSQLRTHQVDAVIHLMAVADYAPLVHKGKISSQKNELTIHCEKTPKILPEIKKVSPETLLISFKLEQHITKEELRHRALQSLRSARGDYVVANLLSTIDEEFHPAEIINAQGEVILRPKTKDDIAKSLATVVQKREYYE